MGVRVTESKFSTAALYDSTSGVAFGPVFSNEDEARGFLDHLASIGERDPRIIPAVELALLASEYTEEIGDDEIIRVAP
jgi:hypothetical protein